MVCGERLHPWEIGQERCDHCELVHQLYLERFSPSPRQKGGTDGLPEREQGQSG
jgi:hypothetical protein